MFWSPSSVLEYSTRFSLNSDIILLMYDSATGHLTQFRKLYTVKPRPNGTTLFDKHLVFACLDLFMRLATMTNIDQNCLISRICLSMFLKFPKHFMLVTNKKCLSNRCLHGGKLTNVGFESDNVCSLGQGFIPCASKHFKR